MTRYVVTAPAEVLTVTGTGEENLVIKLPSGNYMVPMAAFEADHAPLITMDDVGQMSMHRICGLIDRLMRRNKQLELDMRAAEAAGYVKPVLPDKMAPDKPLREYKPLDHGPRDPDVAAPQYRKG